MPPISAHASPSTDMAPLPAAPSQLRCRMAFTTDATPHTTSHRVHISCVKSSPAPSSWRCTASVGAARPTATSSATHCRLDIAPRHSWMAAGLTGCASQRALHAHAFLGVYVCANCMCLSKCVNVCMQVCMCVCVIKCTHMDFIHQTNGGVCFLSARMRVRKMGVSTPGRLHLQVNRASVSGHKGTSMFLGVQKCHVSGAGICVQACGYDPGGVCVCACTCAGGMATQWARLCAWRSVRLCMHLCWLHGNTMGAIVCLEECASVCALVLVAWQHNGRDCVPGGVCVCACTCAGCMATQWARLCAWRSVRLCVLPCLWHAGRKVCRCDCAPVRASASKHVGVIMCLCLKACACVCAPKRKHVDMQVCMCAGGVIHAFMLVRRCLRSRLVT